MLRVYSEAEQAYQAQQTSKLSKNYSLHTKLSEDAFATASGLRDKHATFKMEVTTRHQCEADGLHGGQQVLWEPDTDPAAVPLLRPPTIQLLWPAKTARK